MQPGIIDAAPAFTISYASNTVPNALSTCKNKLVLSSWRRGAVSVASAGSADPSRKTPYSSCSALSGERSAPVFAQAAASVAIELAVSPAWEACLVRVRDHNNVMKNKRGGITWENI